MLARGRASFSAQSFSRFIGAELTAFSEAGAEIRLNVREELRQQYGFVHGGVISYLADNAMTFAGSVSLAGPTVTSEMKINYMRPAVGDVLVARAAAIGSGRTQSVARCEVYSVEGGLERLCAAAQGTIVLARPRAE